LGDVDIYIRIYNPETVEELLHKLKEGITNNQKDYTAKFPNAKMDNFCTNTEVRNYVWNTLSMHIAYTSASENEEFNDDYLLARKKEIAKYIPKFVGQDDDVSYYWTFNSKKDIDFAFNEQINSAKKILNGETQIPIIFKAYTELKISRLEHNISLIKSSNDEFSCELFNQMQGTIDTSSKKA